MINRGVMGIATARIVVKIKRLNACRLFGRLDMLDEAPRLLFKGFALETPLRKSTSRRPRAHHAKAEGVDRLYFNYTNHIHELRSGDAVLHRGLCIMIAAHTTLVGLIQ
jgi:hypothetical protein